jgi:hypothetical protein
LTFEDFCQHLGNVLGFLSRNRHVVNHNLSHPIIC